MSFNLKKVERSLNESRIFYKCDEIMKNVTSFKIGGICKCLAFPENFKKAQFLIEFCHCREIRHFFLGSGTNLLFTDSAYEGIGIGSKMLNKIKLLSEDEIYCESGVPLIKLCRFALFHSLSGLEFAFGIPGSLGGAVLMNAGAYGGEMKDVVLSVDFLDKLGNLKSLSGSNLNFSYRTSVFDGAESFILAARIKCKKGDKNEIKSKMDDLMQRRILKQPLNMPSAGSVFKRPKNGFASKLIESCGLKSAFVGDARVSDKHCGFIVNVGNASCEDVLQLIRKIQEVVLKHTGILLEPEVKFIK